MKKIYTLFILATLHFGTTAQQWENVGSLGFTITGGYSDFEISSNGTLYTTTAINNYSTEVWTFNNTDWEILGASNFSAIQSIHHSSCISDNDSIYVAMSESPIGWKASVMKFDGTGWGYIGGAGFSAGKVEDTDIKTINDSIYVSYKDFTVGEKLSVMKYNGTGWSYIGSQGFSDGAADFSNMEIYNGTPYVVFADMSVGGKLSVMRYDGFNWEYVGAKGFSPDYAASLDLGINSSGVLYVSFADGSAGGKASLMKFDGTNWVYAGPIGFSAFPCSKTELGFDQFNQPYMAYISGGSGVAYPTIQVFNNVSWSGIATASLSNFDNCYEMDFKVISYGKYYLFFSDGPDMNVMSYDATTSVSELTDQNTFTIYPNPSNNFITIDNSREAFESVSIMNLSGKIILSTGFESTIDVSELPNGVYLVELLTETGKKYNRFVKS